MSPSAPTTGRLLDLGVTVTANVRAAEVASGPPLSSVAAIVAVVPPRATPVIVSRVPDTATVAMDASAEDAATVCVSSASGSVMPGSTVTASPTATVTAATVIVAVPRPTPRGYAYLPDVVTDATDVSSEPAETVCASPASASETGTVTVCTAPFDTVRSAIAPTAGRLFGTVTWNVAGAEAAFDAPLSSVAVTAIVVELRSSPVRISRVPVADTVATTVSVDVAVSVCTSRASASVTSTCTVDVAPVGTVQSAIASTAGGLFGNVAVFRHLHGGCPYSVIYTVDVPIPSGILPDRSHGGPSLISLTAPPRRCLSPKALFGTAARHLARNLRHWTVGTRLRASEITVRSLVGRQLRVSKMTSSR